MPISEIQLLVKMKELEPSEDTYLDRITRTEFGRALDAGVEELLRRANQEPDGVFAEAIAFVQEGEMLPAGSTGGL